MNKKNLRMLRCFLIGLCSILFAGISNAQELATLNVNKAYKINRFNQDKCMYANAPNIGIGAWSATDSYYWQFIPATEEGQYYIRNVSTGTYVQSCKIALSQAVVLGPTRVAYKIFLDQTTTNTKGTYYLCSADQDNIDNTKQGSLGLNCGTNVVAYHHISGQNGNSFWNLTELDVEVDPNVKDEESGNNTNTEQSGLDAEKYYFITAKNDANAYIAESSDMLTTRAKSNSEKIFWQFIPVEGEAGVYYVQNAVTKNYMQSSNPGSSVQIAMGVEPMKYKIGKDETAGASTYGLYYLYSTEQNATSNADAMGLNFDGNNTRNVVSWSTATGRANSYWNLTETAFTYDPQYIAAVPTVEDLQGAVFCRLVSSDGRCLTKVGAQLGIEAKLNNATQSWAFVGTGNSTGYYVVNGADKSQALAYKEGEFVFTEIASASLWTVEPLADGGLKFYLLPATEPKTYLTAGEDTTFYVAVYRSPMSLKSQVYYLPCGAKTQTYISELKIQGEDVMQEINYVASAHPGTYYTLHTQEKAIVAKNSTMDLSIKVASNTANNRCFLYFDWNRDGVFDTEEEFDGSAQYAKTITVPADAVLGKTRMRVRITDNGNDNSDGKVNGAVYDYIVNVAEATPTRNVTVKVNDYVRGDATLTTQANDTLVAPTTLAVTKGERIRLEATAANQLGFICWKNGRTLYSTEPQLEIDVTQNLELTACFSPYDDFSSISTKIQGTVDSKNLAYTLTQGASHLQVETQAEVKAVIVYAMNGQIVAKSQTKKVPMVGVSAGEYIVQVITAAGDGSKKIALR